MTDRGDVWDLNDDAQQRQQQMGRRVLGIQQLLAHVKDSGSPAFDGVHVHGCEALPQGSQRPKLRADVRRQAWVLAGQQWQGPIEQRAW